MKIETDAYITLGLVLFVVFILGLIFGVLIEYFNYSPVLHELAKRLANQTINIPSW